MLASVVGSLEGHEVVGGGLVALSIAFVRGTFALRVSLYMDPCRRLCNGLKACRNIKH